MPQAFPQPGHFLQVHVLQSFRPAGSKHTGRNADLFDIEPLGIEQSQADRINTSRFPQALQALPDGGVRPFLRQILKIDRDLSVEDVETDALAGTGIEQVVLDSRITWRAALSGLRIHRLITRRDPRP